MSDPIAYTYEADHHCEACALARFGRDAHGDITGTDSEGNGVGVVAPWDEWHQSEDGLQVLACGTCGVEIDTYHGSECIGCAHDCPWTRTAPMPLGAPYCSVCDDHAENLHATEDDCGRI